MIRYMRLKLVARIGNALIYKDVFDSCRPYFEIKYSRGGTIGCEGEGHTLDKVLHFAEMEGL